MIVRRLLGKEDGISRGRRLKGQAAVEMALVITVLMLLLYGILEVSRLIFINSEVDNAAREAVRIAAYRSDADNAYLRNIVVSKLWMADSSAVTVVGPAYPDSSGRCSYCPVKVTVTYQWTTLVPMLWLGPLELSSSSTKLIENAGGGEASQSIGGND